MTAKRVRCCVVGGGPAGMMAGVLLARAGIETLVLEKHGDFLRDFRGDTVHPSTLELMHELGVLEEFLKRPHQEVTQAQASIQGARLPIADFGHLPTRCKFIAFMPQWDFLNFLAEYGRRWPAFHVRMNAEATDLIFDGERVAGVRVRTPAEPLDVHADLVIVANGRKSALRERAGFAVENLGAPMDVLWMRLPRLATENDAVLGTFNAGTIFIMLNRGDYWQCGLVIAKGTLDVLKQEGLEGLHRRIAAAVPSLANRVTTIRSWDDVKLLTVGLDRLREWARPGLLCIGDAAHTMSPIGGVGINVAVQDAVAAANLLWQPLSKGVPSLNDLRRVERRRLWPVRMTQTFQQLAQQRIVYPLLHRSAPISRPPWALRLLAAWPLLRRLPGRAIGLGVRPEHIQSPEKK